MQDCLAQWIEASPHSWWEIWYTEGAGTEREVKQWNQKHSGNDKGTMKIFQSREGGWMVKGLPTQEVMAASLKPKITLEVCPFFLQRRAIMVRQLAKRMRIFCKGIGIDGAIKRRSGVQWHLSHSICQDRNWGELETVTAPLRMMGELQDEAEAHSSDALLFA